MDRYCKTCLTKVEPTKIGPLMNPLWKLNSLSDWWDCPHCEVSINIADTMNQQKLREKKLKKLL